MHAGALVPCEQTAITMMRRPPAGFEDVIRSYYFTNGVLNRLRERCRAMLASPSATDAATPAASAPASSSSAPPNGRSAEGALYGPISKGAQAMLAAVLKAMDELAAPPTQPL